MASGLRVELSTGAILGQRELPVEDLLFRDAQAVGHSG